MAFFTGFGPRRAPGLAEQPKFLFAIVIWHLNEHSVRVSALNSNIFLISTPFHVVLKKIRGYPGIRYSYDVLSEILL